MQFDIDPLEHRRQIAVDVGIPETDNAISFLLEPKLPFVIAFGVLVIMVMPAVEFDDQMLGGTEEIHDIGANWSLTAEVGAVYREFFQRTPQDALVRRRVGSQLVGCCSADRR
jgi:hypothetical protein